MEGLLSSSFLGPRAREVKGRTEQEVSEALLPSSSAAMSVERIVRWRETHLRLNGQEKFDCLQLGCCPVMSYLGDYMQWPWWSLPHSGGSSCQEDLPVLLTTCR